MKTSSRLLMLLTFSFIGSLCYAQDHGEIAGFKTGQVPQEKLDIPGLWLVDQVTVGNEFLTPTAKWFMLEENGEQTGGNGWVQNSKGTWIYNSITREFLSYNQDDKPDEYGAFSLSFEDNKMIWQREEDGMKVKVILSEIEEKPLAPWDKITGSWKCYSYETLNEKTNVASIADVEPFVYYFGWDRRYRKFDSNGKRIETGIWHIEPHSPWLWLISDANDSKTGQSIKFENDKLILVEKKGDAKHTLHFEKEQ